MSEHEKGSSEWNERFTSSHSCLATLHKLGVEGAIKKIKVLPTWV
jgi:hypothetical protein